MDSIWGPARAAAAVPCRPPDVHANVAWHWLRHASAGDRPVEWADGIWLGPVTVATPHQAAAQGWRYLAPALPPREGGR
jgi:hypothetical protein